LVIQDFVLAAEFAQIEGQILQHNIQLIVICQIGRWQDIENLDDLGVLHPPQNGQLPQRPQSQHSILEDIGIFLNRVDLACLPVLHPVHLAICPAAHDVDMQEALVVDLLGLYLEGTHGHGRGVCSCAH
jgi:hypothetical protein